MIKKYILLVFAAAMIAGCGNSGFDKHHISLNSPKGVDTHYFPEGRRLKTDGKPYMLFFFGTSCGACVAQAPIVNEIYSEFKDIDMVKQHHIDYDVISDKISVDYFSKAVGGVMGVPAIFVFDGEGNLKKRFIGLTPKATLENEIKLVL